MRPDMIGPRKLRPAGSFGEPLFQMTQEDSHRVLKGVVEPMITRGQVNGVMPGAHAAPKPQPSLWVLEKAYENAGPAKVGEGDWHDPGREVHKAEMIPGGLAEGKPDSDFDPEQLMEGMKVEMEHSGDPKKAREIAKDHLTEDKNYYKKLAKMEKGGAGYHMHYQRWHDIQAENPDHSPEIRSKHRQAANLHVEAVREEQRSPSTVKYGMRSPGPAALKARYATLRLEKETGQEAPDPGSGGVGKAIQGQQPLMEKIGTNDPIAGTHLPSFGHGDDLHIETAKHEIQADHFSRQKGGALRAQFHARSAAKLRGMGGNPTLEHRKQAFKELPAQMGQLMRAMEETGTEIGTESAKKITAKKRPVTPQMKREKRPTLELKNPAESMETIVDQKLKSMAKAVKVAWKAGRAVKPGETEDPSARQDVLDKYKHLHPPSKLLGNSSDHAAALDALEAFHVAGGSAHYTHGLRAARRKDAAARNHHRKMRSHHDSLYEHYDYHTWSKPHGIGYVPVGNPTERSHRKLAEHYLNQAEREPHPYRAAQHRALSEIHTHLADQAKATRTGAMRGKGIEQTQAKARRSFEQHVLPHEMPKPETVKKAMDDLLSKAVSLTSR